MTKRSPNYGSEYFCESQFLNLMCEIRFFDDTARKEKKISDMPIIASIQ